MIFEVKLSFVQFATSNTWFFAVLHQIFNFNSPMICWLVDQPFGGQHNQLYLHKCECDGK